MPPIAHQSCSSVIAVAVLLFAHCFFASAAIILPSSRGLVIHSHPALNLSAHSPVDHTLWHIIRDNDGLFSQLHAYLKYAPDIELLLQGASSSITFFAPENVAFGRLSPEELALFESDISAHLKYHMLPHIVVERDMRDGSQEATEQGAAVYAISPFLQCIIVTFEQVHHGARQREGHLDQRRVHCRRRPSRAEW